MSQSRIRDIVARLKSPTMEERVAAIDDLRVIKKGGLSLQEGREALMAASESLPPLRYDWNDSSAELMYAVREKPLPEYVPLIVDLFPRFTNGAKVQALLILALIDRREAALGYIQIMRTHARAGNVPELPTWSIKPKPSHADVLFPELLDYTSVPHLAHAVCSLCLMYCEAKLIDSTALAPWLPAVLEVYEERKGKLLPVQSTEGLGWMWEDDYWKPRAEAADLLSLLCHIPDYQAERELRAALSYRDPLLKCAAVVSLIRIGKDVESYYLEEVAASAEVRNRLFSDLADMLKLSLYPDKFLTQEAIAESAMVGWLTFGTELGRVPDEIELMKVIPVDTETEDGYLDFYVYRFRTYPPHWAADKGWIAGLAGPYLRKDAPSIRSYGYTFSAFEAWDARTPEDHVGNITEIIESWKEYRERKK